MVTGMGALCSRVDKEGDDLPESKAPVFSQSLAPRRLHKMPQVGRPGTRSQQHWRAAISDDREFESPAAYNKARESLQAAERAKAFDAEVVEKSSDVEKQATEIVHKIRAYDWDNTYGRPFDAEGHATGKRAVGQHFLGNVDLINKSWLMDVARHMPKGAHLHIHFNSCLPARFLIQQARDIDAMYIRSTLPLTTKENLAHTRISFMVMTPHEATHVKAADGTENHVPLGDVFKEDYISNAWMPYKKFQRKFELKDEHGHIMKKTAGAETWLERKMLISEEEAHGAHQTGRG